MYFSNIIYLLLIIKLYIFIKNLLMIVLIMKKIIKVIFMLEIKTISFIK